MRRKANLLVFVWGMIAGAGVGCGSDEGSGDPDGGVVDGADAGPTNDAGPIPNGFGRVQGALSVFTPGVASVETMPSWSDRAPEIFTKTRQAMKTKGVTSFGSSRRAIEGVLGDPLAGWNPPRSRVPKFPLSSFTSGEGVSAFIPWSPAFSGTLQFDRGGFVEGEVLVTLRSGAREEVTRLRDVPELSRYVFSEGVFGSPDVLTVRFRDRALPGRVIGADETRWVRSQLDRHPAFVRAELNYYRWALAEPNAEVYGTQWHYPQINLPTAWDITTGSANVVVAVIDDGVNVHPELDRVIAGYDMVSDVTIAGDGDGRDTEPYQVPLSHGTSSVWHGTHVAGTIGAATDNQIGVAGVDWLARLLPVRVLGRVVPGRGAGTSIDVIAGINWAVGVEVPGEPNNPNPAQVLNLSLGGGSLLQAEQDAINAAVNRGAVVVVAAGNDNTDAGSTSLAGYDNVVVVGATDYEGRRAPYSNFGAVVDVMAPGGNMSVDANADGQPDGVLSTYLDRDGTRAGLQFLEGTSMATPHVTGVVALMKSVNPGLSAADAERILKETANPSARCNEGCGAGLVNAGAAVLAARGDNTPDNRPPVVSLGSPRLNIGTNTSGAINVFNRGGGQLDWQARVEGQGLRIEGPTSGALEAGNASSLTVVVDRTGLVDGEYQGLLVVETNGGTGNAAVLFRVGTVAVRDVGTVLIGTVGFDENGEVIVGGAAEATHGGNYTFQLDSEPGDWLVIGLADLNGNDILDEGDYWGVYARVDDPQTVTVEDGVTLSNISFSMVPYAAEEEVGPPPCGSYRACIESCSGDDACEANCTVTQECQTCFTNEVASCGTSVGCGATDLNCLCVSCEAELDGCFGPLLCAGGGTQNPLADVGETCDGTTVICAAPFACDTSVAGGYCTRDCFEDGACGDAICVEFDNNGDDVSDSAFCLAPCIGPGTCPRPADVCADVGFEDIGACLPQ